MQTEDLILVSVDDHVVEPPSLSDFFAEHVAAKYKDRVPRVIRRDDGSDAWLIEGKEIASFGLNAVQGRPPENWGSDPASFDQVRPGCYDVHERIRDMNVNGVLASINFPSWVGLGGQFFAQNDDKDFVAAMIRAYNDWHIHEWCGAYPGRFIPLGLSGFILGADFMAEEIHRLADQDCHAVSFHAEPHRFGMPDHHGDEWDPAWQACQDTGTVMVFHFGAMPNFMPRTPFDVIPHSMPFQTAIFASELLWSPILRKFPTVKLALAEGGIGWVPYFLEKADFVYDHHHRWTGADFGDKLPSQVFREHVQTCFIDDDTGLRNREWIGVDTITWECDYPHSDSTWPQSPEVMMKMVAATQLSDEDTHKVTWENACRWYQFDPFEHRTREECTVGALRGAGERRRHHTARVRRPRALTWSHQERGPVHEQGQHRGRTRRHRRDLGEHGAIPGSADHRHRWRVGYRPGNGAAPPRGSRNRARGRRRRRRPRAHPEAGGSRRHCRAPHHRARLDISDESAVSHVGRRHRRAARRPRRARERGRDPARRPHARIHARDVEPGDRREPHRHVPHDARRAPGDARARATA